MILSNVPSKFYVLCFLIVILQCYGCNRNENKLFTLMPSSYTGITFANNISYNNQMNPYTNHGFYNGGGVAVGDINNDGLPDLFFCSNQGQNKLYLNKGNFKFEDITIKAGLVEEGLWSTGATFVDITGDGLLDLYVCRAMDYKAGIRGNRLYINRGNRTFTEKASSYGLVSPGISTQAAFFDFDNDGDLDCYMLNNSKRAAGVGYDLRTNQRKILDSLGGNKLYRNDGNHFTNVTKQSDIYSSEIGFGLGVTIADINKDGWPDIYISNDYFESDYLYINNHDGTFTESLEKYIREISLFSMGADIADINNDGYPEIFVTDMLPEDESRIKTKTSFENWDKYQADLKSGYYQQFLRNVLQLNRGPVFNKNKDSAEYYFSEIGRFAGVQASDWSWGALIADLDNDGYKDIFVANGMYKDVTDQDFIQALGKKEIKNIKQALDSLSSTPLAKFAFHNNGNLTFTNKAKKWGLAEKNFSNGSVYADLDNDGDLDLVTNNINSEASVYRNNAEKLYPENKFLKVVLQGEGMNRYGFGAKVIVYHDGILNYQEEMPSRGFQSCVDSRLNFGLGKAKKIDSVKVQWPNGRESLLKNLLPNQTIAIKQSNPSYPSIEDYSKKINGIFKDTHINYKIDFEHKEDDYTDFDKQKLSFFMHSTEGPRITKGDVNGDGLEDFYVCGAKGQAGSLYVQTKNGTFIQTNQTLFTKDSSCEDTDCLFFDADGDKDQDLYVCSGGNESTSDSLALIDRLYINDGKGNFVKSPQLLPSKKSFENTSCVDAADFDDDGDIDLFVGVRMNPDKYGYPCKGYILQNNGKGIFTDITEQVTPGLDTAGMITDAKWFDYDRDGKPDLVIAGEYMPIKMFHNEGGKLKEVTAAMGLSNSNGWWNRLEICDLNNDGYPDIVAGNYGLNSRIKATAEKPVSTYVSDFDGYGTIKQILCTYNGDRQYPIILRHDLVTVLPSLKKKFLRYKDYSEKTIQNIFSAQQLSKALKLNAYQMQTCILINNKKGGFILKPLPMEAQFSQVYGIAVQDFNEDGKKDILLGGNFYQCKPEIGINDASYGTLLKGDGKGNFGPVPMSQSNLCIRGAVRDIISIKNQEKKLVIIVKNNDRIQILEY